MGLLMTKVIASNQRATLAMLKIFNIPSSIFIEHCLVASEATIEKGNGDVGMKKALIRYE